jgi:phosphatidylserine/phosphatidylglycerophosphate/cardiolipin synthase-like enzyme
MLPTYIRSILKRVKWSPEPPEEGWVEPDTGPEDPLADADAGVVEAQKEGTLEVTFLATVLDSPPLARVIELMRQPGWTKITVLAYSLDEMDVVKALAEYECERLVVCDRGQTLTSQSQNAKRALLCLLEPGASRPDATLQVGVGRGPTGSCYSHMHQKAYCVEGTAETVLVVGSANCSGNSLYSCYEMAVELKLPKGHVVVEQFGEAAEKLYRHSKHETNTLRVEFQEALECLTAARPSRGG